MAISDFTAFLISSYQVPLSAALTHLTKCDKFGWKTPQLCIGGGLLHIREVGKSFVHLCRAAHLVHHYILYPFLSINIPNCLNNYKWRISFSMDLPVVAVFSMAVCWFKWPECWSHFRDCGLSRRITTSQPVSVSPVTLLRHTLAPIIAMINDMFRTWETFSTMLFLSKAQSHFRWSEKC